MFAWRALPAREGAAPGAYLTVPALEPAGIRVAFTTRHGGTSAAPFASLNLSFLSGDDRRAVGANRARVLDGLGTAEGAWTAGYQVHGARVARATPADRGRGGSEPGTAFPEADGVWTDAPGVALGVLVADCVPVLLADAGRRRIAAVHAGWRGLVAGVVANAVGALGDPDRLAAYLGPAIGPCCYEVGEEVVGALEGSLGEGLTRRGRTAIDLWAAAARALRAAGVRAIAGAALCTRCEPQRFFSHRAGHAARQAMVAVVV